MDLAGYLRKKQELQSTVKPPRESCRQCRQPLLSCYCHLLKPIDIPIKVVILIHPLEDRKRIATGRMTHLLLKNSHLIRGKSFADNVQINELVEDPNNQCVVLYPGKDSISIDQKSSQVTALREHKQLIVFVMDGTWCTAGKMLKQSPNLFSLPRIGFSPTTPSRFRVRKQPSDQCYSTIEAVHQTLDYLSSGEQHHYLLDVFDYLVEKQLQIMQDLNFVRRWRRVEV